MARPKGTTRAKKPILKYEFEKLIDAVQKTHTIQMHTKEKFKRAFTLLYLTGCRVSEIINFKTTDLQEMIDNNEYSLANNTKTKRSRLISFDTNRVQTEMLKEIVPKNIDIYLFVSNKNDAPMSVASFTFQLNKFIKLVLGEYYSTHSFRQGYITIAHQKGLSLEHIRVDIGHKDIATTARYAVVTHKEIAQGKNLRQW
jgi:site-specific recombinase XerD